jgi:Golgi apparatus protein 1
LARHTWLAVLLLTLAVNARGDDPCAAEQARLCPNPSDSAALLRCLRSNKARLSEACTSDLDRLAIKALEVGAGCEGDVYSKCREVQPGEGRIALCLQSQESDLSSSCQQALSRWRNLKMELGVVCRGDAGRLCPGLPEGDGRILACLKSHEKDLTSDCRSAVRKL